MRTNAPPLLGCRLVMTACKARSVVRALYGMQVVQL